MADNKFGFGRIKENIRQMKEVLPPKLAALTQNYFVQSWQNQGWDGKKWQEVNRRLPGTNEYKYPMKKGLGRRTRAILVESGALRRATSNSIRSQRFGVGGIRLIVDLPYASAHNDGNEHLPARPFMKDSPILRVKQVAKIKQFTDRVWQV